MDTIKLYLRSVGMHLRSAAQYRASMIMQVVSALVMTGTELLAVVLMLERFSSLGQWNAREIFFFFGLMQFTFSLVECFGRGFTSFASQVRGGEFDRMLLRPRNLELLVVCSQMDIRRIGSLVVGIAALLYGSAAAGIDWTVSKALVLLFSLAGGGCLILGLFMIEASITFWTVGQVEVINVLTYGGRSTCQYPVDIYPRGFRWIFIAVAPYALTLHLPAAYILGKSLLGIPAGWAFVSPLAGVVFLAAMLKLWRWGVSHYTSTGS